MKHLWKVGSGLAIALALFLAVMTATSAQSPGTAFTYQGQLASSGELVNATCDFTFSLHDAATGGNQVGSTLARPNVAVAEGLFAVSLDYGANAFNGSPRWLAIAVQCPTDSAPIQLTPRQELTPAPYAIFANGAAWSGITGKPAWANSGFQAGNGLTLTGATFAVDPSVMQRRISGVCGTGQAIQSVNADGSVVCVSASTGPQGPAGPVGPQGPAGPAGAPGADGAQGPIGLTGPAGADGAQGPIGLTGPAGADGAQGPIGLTGPAGADGAQGPIGLTGPAGADGAQGPIGLTGPAGADGAQGPIGLTGPAGADGAQGPIGLTGPAGADGAQGPIGLTGPAGADGAQGPIGLTGPAGADGAQGPIGLTGPAGADGAQGPIGLTGPAGADGAQGPIGLTGPAGADGPPGPPGPAGSAGATGAQGLQGPEGPAGANGAQGPAGEGFRTDCATGSTSRWNGTAWVCSSPEVIEYVFTATTSGNDGAANVTVAIPVNRSATYRVMAIGHASGASASYTYTGGIRRGATGGASNIFTTIRDGGPINQNFGTNAATASGNNLQITVAHEGSMTMNWTIFVQMVWEVP